MPSLKPFVANFGRRSRQNDAALNNAERGCATGVITASDETALSDEANLFLGTADVRHFHAKSRRQVDLVIPLFHENLANLFCQGILAESFTLPHSFAAVPDRHVLIFQIKAKNVLGLV
jgi:hypothetical protein